MVFGDFSSLENQSDVFVLFVTIKVIISKKNGHIGTDTHTKNSRGHFANLS